MKLVIIFAGVYLTSHSQISSPAQSRMFSIVYLDASQGKKAVCSTLNVEWRCHHVGKGIKKQRQPVRLASMETHLCSRAQITSMQNDSVSQAHLHALRQFEWGWCIWTSRCALVSRCKDWATADTTLVQSPVSFAKEPARVWIKHWIHWKINHPYLRHNYGTILSSREESDVVMKMHCVV